MTATISKLNDSKAICLLENGLKATITKDKILDPDSQLNLKDVLDVGHIITCRIEKIIIEDVENKFEILMTCD